MPGGDVRLLCIAAGGGTEDTGGGQAAGGGNGGIMGLMQRCPHRGSHLCYYYLFIIIIRFILFFYVEAFSVAYWGILLCLWRKIMVFCY